MTRIGMKPESSFFTPCHPWLSSRVFRLELRETKELKWDVQIAISNTLAEFR